MAPYVRSYGCCFRKTAQACGRACSQAPRSWHCGGYPEKAGLEAIAREGIALAECRHGRSRAMYKQSSEVRFVMPSRRGLPPVVNCRGTSPNHAPRSRARSKLPAFPIAAIKAVAFSTPIPGISVSRRAAASFRASDKNSALRAAIFVSRIFHSHRSSAISRCTRSDKSVRPRPWSL